jgi:hypothetical protein
VRTRLAVLTAALAPTLLIGAGLVPQAAAGPVFTVFTDPTGDTGANGTALPGPLPAMAGLDLVTGTVKRDKADLAFSFTMSEMPDQGSLPEAARLLYHFNVDGVEWRVTVKSVDVGKPDLVAQSGTDRVGKVDSAGHFRLEQCALDTTLPLTLSQCTPVAYLKGTVDPAKATLSWTVPLATLKAKTGSRLTPGTGGAAGTGCEICWVLHYAERSLTPSTVVDDAVAGFTKYVLPKS